MKTDFESVFKIRLANGAFSLAFDFLVTIQVMSFSSQAYKLFFEIMFVQVEISFSN